MTRSTPTPGGCSGRSPGSTRDRSATLPAIPGHAAVAAATRRRDATSGPAARTRSTRCTEVPELESRSRIVPEQPRSLLARGRAEAPAARGRRSDRAGQPRAGDLVSDETDARRTSRPRPRRTTEGQHGDGRCSRSSTCGCCSRSRAASSSTARSATCTPSTTSRSVSSEGETLGIVGESGCGKTTLIRALVRLIDATAGAIRFRGDDITNAGRRGSCEPIRREMQMVFQDPQASLNPRKRVSQILATPLRLRGVPRTGSSAESRGAARPCRALSGEHLNRFPHEFSGGQRQRIGIARALAVDPQADPARRAGLGARRLDPGAGDQPARRAPGRVPPELRLRRPRPERRPPRLRPDRRHVPRQADGGLARRGAVHQADPPLHVGAAGRDPDPRPQGEPARATRTIVVGRAAEPDPAADAAAASTPAARARATSAGRSSRR